MGGIGNSPISAKNVPFVSELALEVSMAIGAILLTGAGVSEAGDLGDGAGEKLLSDREVGETSAMEVGVGEVFQPKKDVNLLGPGERGVLVIIAGSYVSLSRFSAGRAFPVGCNDLARCKP